MARSLQFFLRADDLEFAALLALIDRQSETPVALLRDHPVVHVAQPVDLALFAEFGDPANVAGDLHQPLAQRSHRDVPLVDDAKDDVGLAAPAGRVAVAVVVVVEQQAARAQVVDDRLGDIVGVHPAEEVEALVEMTHFVDRRDDLEIVHLRELVVLAATAWCDVDDAASLVCCNIIPGDDSMFRHRHWPADGRRSPV